MRYLSFVDACYVYFMSCGYHVALSAVKFTFNNLLENCLLSDLRNTTLQP